MPEISISREQYAYIEALRDELAEEVTYGHVRTQDAVQYLIDHHKADGELDVEVDAEVEPDGSGDADGTPRSTPAAGNDAAGRNRGRGGSDRGGDREGGIDPDRGGSPSVDETVQALSNAGPGGGGSGGTSSGGGRSSGGGGSSGSTAGDGGGTDTIGNADSDKVDEMMNLMAAHDDKWEESGGSDGRYQVLLPDGDTESVQTKDDVRALLFKHYR